ncbi:hypothetical protein Ahy_A07g033865 [Arachis hypogaea]|uniref:Endonuclease/exonuclease/phosphatase domain-containing protein n=1 Tax=Arachis hypogaea TaxID=3818 RepID=A0A445CAA7_ARAHY|nr:hypothetical protein Ahy_A07g033865 [Arachis hypogaea]
MACQRFRDWMNECSLIDLGYACTRFTWRGPVWEGREMVYKRLDRALVNADWRMRFKEAKVEVLTRTRSNHHPLLFTLEPQNQRCRDRLFRYEVMWKLHPEFDDFIN